MNLNTYNGNIEDILAVDDQIPEFDGRNTRQKLAARLENKKHLILIASDEGKPVAYKVGYEVSPSKFYSWLGGVIPEYRRNGIATQLRTAQERWAIEHGYTALSVKSMNRYPAMLQLLIASGYQIDGYEDSGCTEQSKIKFIKRL